MNLLQSAPIIKGLSWFVIGAHVFMRDSRICSNSLTSGIDTLISFSPISYYFKNIFILKLY